MLELAHTIITYAALIALVIAVFMGVWHIIDSYTVYHLKRVYSFGRRGKRWLDALLTAFVSWAIVFLGSFIGVLGLIGILTLMGYGE